MLRLRSPATGKYWERAKCLNINISEDDPFFSPDPVDNEEAVDFCNGTVDGKKCPLRDACLLFSLHNSIEYGVWGGMNQLSRKAVRRKFPPKKNQVNDNWKWMTEEQALSGISGKEIEEMRRSFVEY